MLNKTVSYDNKQTTWGSVLLLKTRELSHYLTGKTKRLEFVNPEFGVFRVDSQEIRQKKSLTFLMLIGKKTRFFQRNFTLHEAKCQK